MTLLLFPIAPRFPLPCSPCLIGTTVLRSPYAVLPHSPILTCDGYAAYVPPDPLPPTPTATCPRTLLRWTYVALPHTVRYSLVCGCLLLRTTVYPLYPGPGSVIHTLPRWPVTALLTLIPLFPPPRSYAFAAFLFTTFCPICYYDCRCHTVMTLRGCAHATFVTPPPHARYTPRLPHYGALPCVLRPHLGWLLRRKLLRTRDVTLF